MATKLKIITENRGVNNLIPDTVYIDRSNDAFDFTSDHFFLILGRGDHLYIAHPDKKAINHLYIDLDQAKSTDTLIKIEYWDGERWREFAGLTDETNALTRSGFLYWDRLEMVETAVNGISLKWPRIEPLVHKYIEKVWGINLVFSHDRDLLEENPDVLDFLKPEESSFIGRHQAARKFIVQEIRNQGRSKRNRRGYLRDVDEWDFLDPLQLRQASKYYVMHLIYFNVSDETDDRYSQKSDQYLQKYRDAIDLAYLAIDQNDDGVEDEGDLLERPTTIVRAV